MSLKSLKSLIKKLNWRKLIITVVMLFFALLMILPFIWMVSTSFKTASEVFEYPIQWIPSHFEWDNFIRVWTGDDSFAKYYINSLIVAIVSTIFAIFFASLAAYGFSRVEFKGREIIFLLYLSMMMIPPEVLFVPKFIMFDWMGIYNTLWALIIPGSISIFGVFILRQFFLSIPKEISESAFIDGAGHFHIFLRLILPLAKPAIATFGIIEFSWRWNDYESALIFLIDDDLFTVPLGLQTYILEHSVDYPGMMTAAASSILPMIILFILAQKYVIQGISNTAVKG